MATSTSTVNTLNITTIDDAMNETVFKINGSPDSETSLTAIREVYKPVIEGNYLYSRQGYKVTAVSKASKVTVVTTSEEYTE